MPKNVQSTPFAKLKMILQKLDNFHKQFGHNKSGGLWLSATVVLEYIRAGKCKRDVDNRIVLSTRAFIPRNIPGALFKDHIDEWHRRNPNQLAAGQLMLGVISNSTSEPPVSASLNLATRHTHPDL